MFNSKTAMVKECTSTTISSSVMFSHNFAQIARFTTFKRIVSTIIVAIMLILALIIPIPTPTTTTFANNNVLNSLTHNRSTTIGATVFKTLGIDTNSLFASAADKNDDDESDKPENDEKSKGYFDQYKGRGAGENEIKDNTLKDGDSLTVKDTDTNGNFIDTMDQSSKIRRDDGSLVSNVDDNKNDNSRTWHDTFAMVIRRIMPGYYISSNISITPQHSDAWDIHSENYEQCTDLDSGNHTTHVIKDGKRVYNKKPNDKPNLANPNCDIPGLGSEGFQDFIALIDGHGVRNGERQSSQSPYGLGVATSLLPTDGVPFDVSNQPYKYTGLEMFGYNLRWSEYNGEWDHVKVLSAVRFTSSMTFVQGLQTIGQAMVEGAQAAAGELGKEIGGKFEKGDILGGIMAFFNPFTYFAAINKAISTMMYRIIANITNSFEFSATADGKWYRPYFINETVYGARTLSIGEKTNILVTKVNKSVKTVYKNLDNLAKETKFDENALRDKVKMPEDDYQSKPTVPAGNATGTATYVAPQQDKDWKSYCDEHKDEFNNIKKYVGIDAWTFVPEGTKNNNDVNNKNRYEAIKKAIDNAIKKMAETHKSNNKKKAYENVQKALYDNVKNSVIQPYFNQPESVWLYCVDSAGNPDGQPADPDVLADVKKGRINNPGMEAYDANGNYRCKQKIRPTIIGGVFGSSRKDPSGQYIDSRRSMWQGVDLIKLLIGNQIDAIGAGMLSIAQNVTMLTNTVIGACFEPILEKFGLKDLLLKWISKLRETIYFQLIVFFISIAGVVVIVRFLSGHPIKSFQKIASIILSFGLGVILLVAPARLFTLVDDIPTAIERGLAGAIFDASGEDIICEASGTPKNTVSTTPIFKHLFGSDDFNPDAQIRKMQCRVWEVFIANPWSYGQWGVNLNKLWANGYANSQKIGSDKAASGQLDVSGDTQQLVGDAPVNMGNGIVAHNWGLYQIAMMGSGSITTEDPTRPSKILDHNMYRIVDLQAGPSSGKGRFTKYLQAWSGRSNNKLMIGLMSLALSIIGLLVLGQLALKKLEFTLVTVLMLIVSPVIFLIGVIPGKGNLKMRQYLLELLGYVVKRIMVVVMLAFGLEMMCEISMGSGSSWLTSFLGCFMVLLMLFNYVPDMLKSIVGSISPSAGGWNTSVGSFGNSVFAHNPGLMAAKDTVKNAFRAGAGAMIGGVLAGRGGGSNSFKNISMRMMKDYATNGGATQAFNKRNSELNKQISNINSQIQDARKHHAGGAMMHKLYGEKQKLEAKQFVESRDFEEKRNSAARIALAQGYDVDGKTGEIRVDEHGNLVRNTNNHGLQALENIAAGAMAMGSAVGQNMSRQYMMPEITAGQIAADNLRTLMLRSRNIRIHHGQTSPLFESISYNKQQTRLSNSDAERKLYSKIMNGSGLDSAGRITTNMVDPIINSNLTTVAQSAAAKMGLTAEQLAIMAQASANKQQLLADWEVAEQTGDWGQVRKDLQSSLALVEGDKHYDKAFGATQDTQNLIIAARNQIQNLNYQLNNATTLADKTKIMYELARSKQRLAGLIGGDANVGSNMSHVIDDSGLLKVDLNNPEYNSLASADSPTMVKNRDGKLVDVGSLSEQELLSLYAKNRKTSVENNLNIQAKKDEIVKLKNESLAKILGSPYSRQLAYELSDDGRQEFRNKLDDAMLKYNNSNSIADRLDASGNHDAANKLRESAKIALQDAKRDFSMAARMANNWENALESRLTAARNAWEDGKIKDDKYENTVRKLFEAAETIKQSDSMLESIEAMQSVSQDHMAFDKANRDLSLLQAADNPSIPYFENPEASASIDPTEIDRRESVRESIRDIAKQNIEDKINNVGIANATSAQNVIDDATSNGWNSKAKKISRSVKDAYEYTRSAADYNAETWLNDADNAGVAAANANMRADIQNSRTADNGTGLDDLQKERINPTYSNNVDSAYWQANDTRRSQQAHSKKRFRRPKS